MTDVTAQQALATALLGGSTVSTEDADPLTPLINALPPYGDPDFEGSLIDLFAAMIAIALPTDQPTWDYVEAGFPYPIQYVGPGTFAEAIYPGYGPSEATQSVASATAPAGPTFWTDYGIAVTSQAAVTCEPGWAANQDSNQVSADLTSHDLALQPYLQTCVAACLQYVFPATSTVYADIADQGTAARTLEELSAAMLQENFRATFNAMAGGDDAEAASWFLYMLWNTAASLGCPDVDAMIATVSGSGLGVPGGVGQGSWSNGGYSGWHKALSGADLPAVTLTNLAMTSPWQIEDPNDDWLPYVGPEYASMFMLFNRYWQQ